LLSRPSYLHSSKAFRYLSTQNPKIIYSLTDEAPALATYSLLPIIRRFTVPYGIDVETSDISVAARILAQFPEHLESPQADCLSELGELAKTPEANIIKLPNVSASIPQLVAAIEELQSQGYNIPNFVEDPSTDEEKDAHERYSRVLGSAVNPVLREGNSDRRVAGPVKAYAQKNPHRMGKWTSGSKSHVSHMEDKDFFSSEQSYVCDSADDVKISLQVGNDTIVLKESTKLQAGEVIDAAVMNTKALRAFFREQIDDAKKNDILLSLHLKATMMKISDPIMFGHCVKEYFADAFEKHSETFDKLGVNANNGIGDAFDKISSLPAIEKATIESDLLKCIENGPRLAMVDSNRGITNLHVPSDVIIDASMPVVVRFEKKKKNKNVALSSLLYHKQLYHKQLTTTTTTIHRYVTQV